MGKRDGRLLETLKEPGAWPVRVKGAAEGCQLRDTVLMAQ